MYTPTGWALPLWVPSQPAPVVLVSKINSPHWLNIFMDCPLMMLPSALNWSFRPSLLGVKALGMNRSWLNSLALASPGSLFWQACPPRATTRMLTPWDKGRPDTWWVVPVDPELGAANGPPFTDTR